MSIESPVNPHFQHFNCPGLRGFSVIPSPSPVPLPLSQNGHIMPLPVLSGCPNSRQCARTSCRACVLVSIIIIFLSCPSCPAPGCDILANAGRLCQLFGSSVAAVPSVLVRGGRFFMLIGRGPAGCIFHFCARAISGGFPDRLFSLQAIFAIPQNRQRAVLPVFKIRPFQFGPNLHASKISPCKFCPVFKTGFFKNS